MMGFDCFWVLLFEYFEFFEWLMIFVMIGVYCGGEVFVVGFDELLCNCVVYVIVMFFDVFGVKVYCG